MVVYLPDLFHSSILLFTYRSKQENERPSSSLSTFSYPIEKFSRNTINPPYLWAVDNAVSDSIASTLDFSFFLSVDIHTSFRPLMSCITGMHKKEKKKIVRYIQERQFPYCPSVLYRTRRLISI